MKNENNKMFEEIKKLLEKQLGSDDTMEFCKVLIAQGSLVSDAEFSENDKRQIQFVIPAGADLRILVDKIITLLKQILPAEKYFKLLLDFSDLMIYYGQLDYAAQIVEELIDKVKYNTIHLSLTAEAYLLMSKIWWSQANWEESLYYVHKAERMFRLLKDTAGSARCENMLGTIYGEKGEMDKALKHFEAASSILNDNGEIATNAAIESNLGVIYTILGDFDKAIWNYKNAKEKFEKLNDLKKLARIKHNLGMMYTRMEDFESALDEFNGCITISLEKGYLSNCAISYISKAYIYTKLNNPALADAFTDKAMEIACRINDKLTVADVYKIKGMIFNNLQNFELSEEFFENSLRLNKDFENQLNEAEVSIELAKTLQLKNRQEKAEAYVNSANNYFKKVKHNSRSDK
jgi:tetratricopeptide (TPR) repeat protein